MTKKALIILNPSSGKNRAKEYEGQIVQILKQEYDQVQVEYTKGAGDGTKLAGMACDENYDLVVSMGGDGTVNEVINGLALKESRPPYGIIPLGTVNDLSKALNISQDPEEAMKMMLTGTMKAIDIGKVNDHYFGNVAAVGRVPEAIHEVSGEEKSRLGPLAYYIKGVQRILEKETFSVRLSFDEVEWEGEIAAIIMGLTKSLGVFKKVFPKAEVDDGLLHVMILRDFSLIETLKMTPNLLTENLEDSENIIYMTVKKIRVEAMGEKEYTSDIDGDEGPDLPLDVEVLPKFLRVLVPDKKET